MRNDRATVQILSVFLAIVSGSAILVRLATKWQTSRKFHSDDALAVLALVRRLIFDVPSPYSISVSKLQKVSRARTNSKALVMTDVQYR